MRKEVVYLVVGVLIALGIIMLSYWDRGPATGLVVFDEYENQTACENAGHTWNETTEQNCTTITTCINETTDCGPCLEYEIINETTNETGDCISWSSCINETCSDEENCTEIVTGGQCIGDICDSSHLDLCSDETNCTSADGYWYDDSCNEDECSSDSHCDSGYECSSGNCVAIDEDEEDEDEESESTSESTQTSITAQTIAPVSTIELLVYEISDLELTPLQSQEVILTVENTGTDPVSACKIQSGVGEEFSEWINIPEDSKNLNSEDMASFSFDLSVPEYADIGSYALSVLVVCSYPSLSQEKEFTVNVVKKTFEFNLTDVRKIRDDEVRAKYILSDLSGSDQSIELNFALFDNQSQKVSEITDLKNLSANLSEEFDTILEINESVEGNLTLTVDLNSETYSSSVQEPIVLTAPSILGFAVLDRIGGMGSIAIVIIAIAALVSVVFIVRRIRASR